MSIDGSPARDRASIRPVHVVARLLALGAALITLAACSGSSFAGSSSARYQGDTLPQPISLTAADRSAAFQSSQGGSTTLAAVQRGRLMLLYFGYTQCPDVCPTTMADLGIALRQLPRSVQAQAEVVFVTADPARDTPAVMRTWLSNFDPTLPNPFLGLTAGVQQIDAVARSVGIPLEPPKHLANGTITVQHGAQTLAFVDGKASVVWLAGTTPGAYAHDIEALVTHQVRGA